MKKSDLIITPEKFQAAANFVLSDKEMQERLYNHWYGKATDYTKAWEGKKDKNGFYDRLARKLSFNCWQQYWSIDAIFYKEWQNCAEEYCVKFISLAFEHENNRKRSPIGWNRLLAANASLKVLATYIPFTEEKKWLKNYDSQLRDIEEALPGFSDRQKHIAMFCYTDKDEWCWRYHLYKDGGFQLMK